MINESLKKLRSWFFENQSLRQTVAKNTFWLFTGQTVGRLLRAILIIYAARILGPASWGAFSFAIGIITLMTTFSDIGINAIVTRESAKGVEIRDRFFAAAFFLKTLLITAGAILIIFGAPLITPISEAKGLFSILALVFIFDSFRNLNFSLSRAQEKMEWESGNEIITNVGITGLGFLFLSLSPTSRMLALSYALATGIGLLAILYQLGIKLKNLAANFDITAVKPLLNMAWPFALASSLGIVMINTDTIMLGWLRSAEEVGWYSASQRLIQFLYVLPAIFATSLFPTFSRLAGGAKESFIRFFEKALGLSLLTATPIAVFGFLLGDQIISILFGGAYQNSIPAFQILILTVLIIFPSILVSNALLAYNLQKKFIVFSALGAGGNVIFNLLLIPPLGIAGCALATLITQLIANSFIWRNLWRERPFTILPQLPKIILVGIVSTIVTLIIRTI